MTTDVINGVPRELLHDLRHSLEELAFAGELELSCQKGVVIRCSCKDCMTDRAIDIHGKLRALLATAQPADHSEHDLNMVSKPAADGEREAFIRSFNLDGKIYYDENTRQWLPCRDSVEGFQIAQRATEVWIGWQARAAQPQQAVAVTDEVRRLREALERVKLTEKEARHHSVSTVAYWNNAVTACISVLAAQAGEVGK